MIYLIFSILSSAAIFVIFKLIAKFKVNTFNAIMLNYVVASSLGFIVFKEPLSLTTIAGQPWFIFSIIVGALFIVMFYVIALSSQKAGISVTTVASKMSVIIPILFSVLYFNENVNALKIIGICTALVAVFLTIMRNDKTAQNARYYLLPLILFIGMGIVDASVKYSQEKFGLNEMSSLFSAVVFSFAGIIAILVSIFNVKTYKHFREPKVYLLGFMLGITNFGTIYFLINALNSNIFDSSVLFGINNIGIVGVSVITGLIGFREKLSWINWIGIALSAGAIFLLSNA
ncbi:MAG: EamA/RhaT family transporter [Bacteroidota bacterium]